jgi:hypothetical protein
MDRVPGTWSAVYDGVPDALFVSTRRGGEGDLAIVGGASTVNWYWARDCSMSCGCISRRSRWARASGSSRRRQVDDGAGVGAATGMVFDGFLLTREPLGARANKLVT